MLLAIVPTTVLGASAETEAWTRVEIPSTVEDGGEYQVNNETYRVIRTAAKLNELAAADTNCSYLLANDIDYAGGTVTQIHLHDDAIFDGNGYAIKGFPVIDGTAGWSLFLNGSVDGTTKAVKNLTVGTSDQKLVIDGLGTTGSGTNGHGLAALFERILEKGTTVLIENVTVYANIDGEGGEGSGGYCSGFVGLINDAIKLTYRNCAFYGSVSSSLWNRPVSGFLAKLTWKSQVVMEDCVNYGAIKAGSGSYASGFVGFTEHNNNTLTITRCINVGSVEGSYAGGFVGANGDHLATILNSINVGSVRGTACAGGIVGVMSGTAGLENCANLGAVGVTATKGSGELIGRMEANEKSMYALVNCLTVGGVSTQKIVGFDGVEETPTVADVFTDSKETMIKATTIPADQALTWLKENITYVDFTLSEKVITYSYGDATGTAKVKYVEPVTDVEPDQNNKPVGGDTTTDTAGNDTTDTAGNDTTSEPSNGADSSDDSADASEEGCFSMVGGGLAILLVLGGAVCLRRKED